MSSKKIKARKIAAFIGVIFSPALMAQTTKPDTAKDSNLLDNVVVIGTRRTDQTVLKSATPVEVITARQLEDSGAKNLSGAIAELSPSINYDAFSNSNNSGARPLQFRGLGPDEVLILVNGKRRHSSAMMQGKASFGRGAQFVDLNNIPISAVDHIEILRDGASAQYGSDAIAGVINVVLREADHGGNFNVRTGTYGEGRQGLEKTYSAWRGFQLGEDGFLTLSAEWLGQKRTNNPFIDTRQQYFAGDPREATINRHVGSGFSADVDSKSIAANAEIGLGAGVRWYSFLTYADRYTAAAGVYRRPNEDTNVRAIFPDGFSPDLQTTSKDIAVATGLKFGDIDQEGAVDISLNYGQNIIDETVDHSVNASLGNASPTNFYLGKMTSAQTNANLDYTKNIPVSFGVKPLTFGAGATARTEQYKIGQGAPAGYAFGTSTIIGGPNNGQLAAPGVQGFTTYQPQDVADIKRTVMGAYLSLEQQFTEKFQVGIAGRGEHYNDFGWTATGKVSARYDFTPDVALRGTVSNGFRAPSVGQVGFSNSTVTWVGGSQFNTRILPVSNPAAQALGATALKPEKSNNYTLGLVLRPTKRSSITIDTFQIDIKDRITLTDNLTGTFVTNTLVAAGYPGVAGASFLVNGVDTRTRGIDIVGKQELDVASGKLELTTAFNISRTTVQNIHANPAALQNSGLTLIGRQSVGIIEHSAPSNKLLLNARYDWGKWSTNVGATRYGAFDVIDVVPTADDHFNPQWVADLNATYKFTKQFSVTLGANNLFDSYPTYSALQLAKTGGSSGPYLSTAPGGALGRFIYANANYSF
jgi:iron complex outermembrane receptor protein